MTFLLTGKKLLKRIELTKKLWLNNTKKARSTSGTSEPISSIAYKLGFEYPANFSKFFKSQTGMSPNQFRKY
ncbi:helix-turn-helix domain-containing protein [Paenibacillus sp. W2I17]|uniref:helix-turn-helix domain-containing protein n=1 Tax=Paenibacillus sp. W2I17 TaxID=3042311 RepID=UPI00359470FC